ncbi:MAG: hypothetical protein COB67_00910 [SAR324 cluster bacterium]|uniref:Chemotaxis protein CheA n=1 Tax=SAR324 cluster bacterium TaxID=2024889 RepID=A0A2A4TB21_9DELT|nr:MAG: hypothetical protein COB67_00910 [SAR324 cluster bacterium]
MVEQLEISQETRQELEQALVPVRQELNLKLVMADLREYRLPGCGEIMNLFDSLATTLDQYSVPYFQEAINFVNNLLTEVVTEHISHYTGLSYVLNLYEFLEEALDDFLVGENEFEFFDQALVRLEKLFAGVEEVRKVEPAKTEDVIQDELPADILEDGLASDFINEAMEGLEVVEENLLSLEENGEQPERVDQVFRVMHTLKGTAGFLGMPIIGKIAHRTEDILGQVRERKQSLGSEGTDLLFTSVDTLKNLVNQFKEILSGQPPTPVNLSRFYDKLSGFGLDEQGEAILEENSCVAEAPPVENSAQQVIPMPGEQSAEAQDLQKKQLDVNDVIIATKVQPSVPEKRQETATKNVKSSKFTEMLKVPAEKLDELAGLVGEMVVALSLLTQNPAITEVQNRTVHKHLDHLEKITESLRDKVLGIRMFPISTVFNKLSRQVRDLSKKSNKKINLNISGAETLVDKTIIDNIYAPLMHLVRNSIDHGIEDAEERVGTGKDIEGRIQLDAQHLGDSILITIKDDGKGLNTQAILAKAIDRGLTGGRDNFTDKEIFSFIFLPGFSTAKKVTDISGRGVGLDVVRRTVESLRGKVTIDSIAGQGTSFILNLPLTTSIIEGLVVRVGTTRFVLPILDVYQTVTPLAGELKGVQGKGSEFFLFAGNLVPIVRIHKIYDLDSHVVDPSEAVVVVVKDGDKKYGLMVDELLHRQQIVIQSMGTRFEALEGISGGTILGDGRVGLILDPLELIHNLYSRIHKAE